MPDYAADSVKNCEGIFDKYSAESAAKTAQH